MIEVNNLTNFSINRKFLKRVAETVLKGENNKKGSLSIALVGLKRIQKLNKAYRKKDYPTDVLSFNSPKEFPAVPEAEKELGEVIICPHQVKKNAKKFNSSFKKELVRVLIHGILHLLGYDHEKSERKAKEMRERENFYLAKIFK